MLSPTRKQKQSLLETANEAQKPLREIQSGNSTQKPINSLKDTLNKIEVEDDGGKI